MKAVKHTKTDRVSHAKCSIKVPFESDINKHDRKSELRSLGISELVYENKGIDTSKKSAPFTSLMEGAGHEEKVGTGVLDTDIIETLNVGQQASRSSFILTDVPKLDRPLKYDSPTHVLHGSLSNFKTMCPKSLADGLIVNCNSNIPRIRKDLGSIATIHNTKVEEPQRRTHDVAFLVDEMLMLNFDPGGVYSRNDMLTFVVPKYGTDSRFIAFGDLTTSLSESWIQLDIPIDRQHNFRTLVSNVIGDRSCLTLAYRKGVVDESWGQNSYELHNHINHELKHWITSKLLEEHNSTIYRLDAAISTKCVWGVTVPLDATTCSVQHSPKGTMQQEFMSAIEKVDTLYLSKKVTLSYMLLSKHPFTRYTDNFDAHEGRH